MKDEYAVGGCFKDSVCFVSTIVQMPKEMKSGRTGRLDECKCLRV